MEMDKKIPTATVNLYNLSDKFKQGTGPGGSSAGNSNNGPGNELTYKGKDVRVYVQVDVISSGSSIEPDGFCEIRFKNIGDVDATIFDSIPLKASDPEWELRGEAREVITNRIRVRFSSVGSNKLVLVTKIYRDFSK